jgi:NAD(P)-dependent dehydrogenase (short-subunit alcohol dehydrogenase family)
VVKSAGKREREESMAGRLAGKRAIVTGAGSGIGRASVLRFAQEGAQVLAVDRAADAVEETLQLAKKAGGEASALAADVGEEAAVIDYVARCIKAYGGLEVVFANAGISGGWTPLFEQTVDYWTEILRVNLIGPFLALKHAGQHMARQGKGSIILTASVAALRANAGGNAYAASKAGVVSLAQTGANSLFGTGVRVNAICPGLIETGMTKPIFDQARAKGSDHKIGQLNALQRAAQPIEIAEMAVFLASDEASYVNGQAFAVDGGLSSTHPFAPRARR